MPPFPADYGDHYTAAQVCAAAEISSATLKNWVSREPQVVLMSDDNRERAGKGNPILFSFYRVMQIVLTAELVKLELPPRRAAEIALKFSDTGDTHIPDPNAAAVIARMPAQLFPTGYTLLLGYAEDAARTLNVTAKTSLLEIFGQADVCAVVLVNPIHQRVRAALGG